MRIKEKIRKILETSLLSLAISGVNLFFPGDPGFIGLYFLPYAVAAVCISSYYGRRYGLISLGVSILSIAGLLPLLLHIIYSIDIPISYWEKLLNSSYIPIPIILAFIYLFGMIRAGYMHSIEKMKERIKELARRNHRLNRISEAQTEVNRELEERVSKQQDSVTNLYAQIQSMNSLDHKKILQVLLETVVIFTKTKKASIWSVEEDDPNSLALQTTTGWSENENTASTIPLDGSIEGWVFRNRNMFSARMLLQYENLTKICTGRNIITLPIALSGKVWGVLNIEDMPFEKYNLYTEQLLTIIVSLTRSALENALEYESLVQKEETDTATGLPLFSQLYRFLDEKIKGPEATRGYISIVVLEIVNMDKIISDHGNEGATTIFRDILQRMDRLTGGRAKSFKYKNNNQCAYAFTDMDYDGVSMFCLEALGSISEGGFRISNTDVAVELILGYAVAGKATSDVNELLDEAEHLLEIQKV